MSELNNWLQYQEDEEFERFKTEKNNERRTKAAMLAGLGLAASLGVVAAKADEAKADTQGQEVHDLLLCTYDNGSSLPVGTGYIATNPNSPGDNVYPQSFNNVDPEKIPSYSTPLFWKGYIFRSTYNYYTGASIYGVYKMVNGQEVETGQLPNIVGSDLFDIISSKSGIITGTDGKYYKFVDTGSTVNLEELGDIPQWGALGNSYGGYMFNEHPDLNNQHKSYVLILNEDDILNSVPGLEVPLASEIELQTDGTNKESSGLDIDEQTGELVVALQHGFVTAQLPPLDADGKLPADFSLTELTFSQNSQKTNLGKSTMDTFANQGYKYFKASNAKSIFAVAPDAQKYELTSAQLCGNSGITIARILKLKTGGIYVILDDDFNIPPFSLVPASDPTKFIAPGVPFEKIVDEPINVTQHIISNGCTAIPSEYQPEFESIPTDPCADVTCPPPDEQCKTAACDSETGDCVDANKIDGTTCDADANACTVGDACADGQCAPGTPKTCPQPAEQCEQSAGCNPATGNCGVENKADGAVCNDENPDTKDDQCANGVCEGTPIADPEQDTVEPGSEPEPDGDDADAGELVEEVEPDEDVVEACPEGGDSDVANPDTVEPDADVAGQEVEQETDTNTDNTTPPEVEEDQGGNETEGEAQEGEIQGEEAQEEDASPEDDSTPVIEEETPGKTPGCSCDVSDTQRQQRGVKEMLSMFGLAALAVLGLRRKESKKS